MKDSLALRLVALAAICLSTGASFAFSEDDVVEPKPLSRKVFMRIKLHSSEKVLEGIVTRNFDLIDSGAKEMKAMSEASNWPKADDETYKHYGAEFRRLCQKMSAMAKDKNLEGVSFAHIQITTSCIACHDYVHSSLKRTSDQSSPFQLIPNARSKTQPPEPREN
ncbi:MAG: hypothetical protein NXI22_19660 [bacterium]|nr:hypothetical protein [bacterium]